MSLAAMRSAHMDYPIEVSIETLALCNARCTFCPIRRLPARVNE
jgi:hypothetical protein